MRADRLVAALLILQARGRVTAQELGQELEVSTRTARRDLEGLAMAGIPVYSRPGRGGGWTLIGGSRTDLSGLTAAEARTLFLPRCASWSGHSPLHSVRRPKPPPAPWSSTRPVGTTARRLRPGISPHSNRR
jgi:predicted DNA-binding transcriptional regulator YafY